MTNTTADQKAAKCPESACEVCGTQSVFVVGAGLSLCSQHAQMSLDYGWLPVRFADDRHNDLEGEPVY